jgi:hypothetical protein
MIHRSALAQAASCRHSHAALSNKRPKTTNANVKCKIIKCKIIAFKRKDKSVKAIKTFGPLTIDYRCRNVKGKMWK